MRFAAIGARRRRKKELYRRVSGTDNCVPSRDLSCLVLPCRACGQSKESSGVRVRTLDRQQHGCYCCTWQIMHSIPAKHHTFVRVRVRQVLVRQWHVGVTFVSVRATESRRLSHPPHSPPLHFYHHRIVSPWIHQCLPPPLGESHRRHLGE